MSWIDIRGFGHGGAARSRLRVYGGMPGWVPRAASVVLALSAFALMAPPYAIIAVALAVVGALVPGWLGTWGCAMVIGFAQLSRPEDAADWRPYVTLAVVHLLHVLGALSIVVPWRSVLEARALRRPLLRWLAIQVPAQAALAAVLLASGVFRRERILDAPTAALFGIVATVFLAGIAVLLVRSSPRR
ncbi:hypothetical protein [Microbacterium candidum]|uniref:Uncharacterized protein n=1 Tax=Microbacterium candidum TaxID=3041922 RepID=A0ABT7N4G1_9MICO|nr:hypothetical protein [Microbacterium sp. ASV49]MDL9981570.1 hypothetical protein [Microbacterium sp. ASV49]